MRFSVGMKIGSGYTLVLLLLLTLAGFSVLQFTWVERDTKELVEVHLPGLERAVEAQEFIMSALSQLQEILLTEEEEESRVRQMEEELDAATKDLKELKQYVLTAEGQEMVDEVQEDLQNFWSKTRQILTLEEAGDHSGALAGHKALQPVITELRDDLDRLTQHNKEEANANGATTFQAVDRARWIALILSLAALALGVAISLFLTRAITRPLQELVTGMQVVAGGDLTHPMKVHSRDEFGDAARAFATMAENLRSLIRRIHETSEAVSSSSQELASSANEVGQATQQVATTIQQLAKGADEQAKNASLASETVEQVSAATQQVAASAQKMAENSSQAAELAKVGQVAVEKAVSQMSNIKKTVDQSAQAVKGLGERSRQISQIVDVITGIADQTNLLALNAAIEAARAGEQGRGFAVVAEEVRKLAEQSRQAAEQISNLIQEIQDETLKAVESMNAGTTEVEQGVKVVSEAGETFTSILNAVYAVVQQINEVSAAAEEMAASSDRAVKAVENIAAITEETAAGAEEVSASSEEQSASVEEIASSAEALAELAQELQKAVAVFKV